jgi:hypothetical protein
VGHIEIVEAGTGRTPDLLVMGSLGPNDHEQDQNECSEADHAELDRGHPGLPCLGGVTIHGTDQLPETH